MPNAIVYSTIGIACRKISRKKGLITEYFFGLITEYALPRRSLGSAVKNCNNIIPRYFNSRSLFFSLIIALIFIIIEIELVTGPRRDKEEDLLLSF